MRNGLARVALLSALTVGASARADFTPANPPDCSDGIDNDNDGLTDFQDAVNAGDPGCDSWNDPSEVNISYSPRVKARLAILFDTSGSMTWHVCEPDNDTSAYAGGDGSLECAGRDVPCCEANDPTPDVCSNATRCDSPTCSNGQKDDSRIYKVKQGLYDAIAAYGELEYSLYRFHQDPVDDAQCPAGSSHGTGPFYGWAGADRTGGNCSGFNTADRLVQFSPENQRFLLEWIDGRDNWVMNATTDVKPPGGQDFEVRGTGFTPISGSLNRIRSDLTAIRTADSAKSCRPYVVVAVTDGLDTCSGQTAAESAAGALNTAGFPVYVIGFASASLQDEMNAIASRGGTSSAFLVDNPASLSAALAQIAEATVLVEKCNGQDDDCDGIPDNGFNLGPCNNGQLGACYREGTFVCVSDTATACNAPHIDPPAEEPAGCNGIDDDCDGIIDDGLQCAGCGSEICNGRDDDCDGMTDEGDLPGEGAECGFAEGECQPGHYECEGGRLVCKDVIGPTTEICNGKDDNCDGVIDLLTRECYSAATGCVDADASPNAVRYVCKGRCRPGTQTCTIITQPNHGACVGEVGPTVELCNGQDDDCDGTVDEGFNVGDECEVGTGLCKTKGKLVCSPDGSGVVCDAPVISGTGEVCNGIDDDCDGVIDDLPSPPPSPIGEPCGTCGGVYQCKGGLVCTGGASNPEVCNDEDDDCNGVVDDGILPGVGEPCVPTTGGQPDFMVTGECRAGRKECIAGGLACVGFSGPNPEVCNGRDDDCDGVSDDAAACPSPTDACYQSQCVSPCAEGEFPCPFGYFCKTLGSAGRFCIPNPCTGKVCGTGEVCSPDTGMCINPCEGVECPDGTQCRSGRCVDCFTLGCPANQVCVEDANRVGRCTADRCAGVTCGEGQTCKDGTCTSVACVGGCDAGQVCEKGQCVAQCSADLCFGASCAGGQVCNPSTGRCITDPCTRANCGTSSCSVTCEGEATCGLRSGVDVLATGSGGFQCEIGSVSSRSGRAFPVLLLMGIAVLIVRRRRR